MTTIDDRAYDTACHAYQERWSLVDQTLYALCSQHPDHQNRRIITAKLALIGRTYVTGIERQILSVGTQASALNQLAKFVYTHGDTVDHIFAELRPITEPLTPLNLEQIVIAHGRFVGLLSALVRQNRNARSFASKYLHFHCPAVPIYDNVAAQRLKQIQQGQSVSAIFELPAGADHAYYAFVLGVWKLYQQRQQTGRSVTVRMLVYYLLS
jgi:hypothetical protein